MLRRRLDLWLPSYALGSASRARGRRRRRQGTLTHVLFLVCDHFEPRHGIANESQPNERLRRWREGYADLQQRCRAAFGSAPAHTWFYPPHHGIEHLAALSEMVFDGMGEVELHYHHGNDTAESLTRDLRHTIEAYRRWGFLLESGQSPRTAFGFIHGDWALDNSGDERVCGVNGELSILKSLGCWGDFTMPSANACQTRKINSIYYAVDDPRRSKSHDRGVDAQVGRTDPQGLFLMQGPLAINWHAPLRPRVENGSLTTDNWGRADRIRKWLDCNVHVKDRPEWLFVKLHAHGAIEADFDALFGERAFRMHRMLNEEFNDGRRFRLHYVTARQAYNVAKAAENGMQGDPSAWLDYRVRPPAHRYYTVDAAHEVVHCTAERLTLRSISPPLATVRTHVGALACAQGPLQAVDVDDRAGCVRLETAGAGEVIIELRPGWRIETVQGAGAANAEQEGRWRLSVAGRCELRIGEDRALATSAAR